MKLSIVKDSGKHVNLDINTTALLNVTVADPEGVGPSHTPAHLENPGSITESSNMSHVVNDKSIND